MAAADRYRLNVTLDGERAAKLTRLAERTHTQEGTNDPWWEVDLGSEFPIESIVIYNRVDGNLGTRLKDYTLLVRDELPAVAEKEENGGFDTAQALTLPCAVEGTIKGERDVDVYTFDGKKGDTVTVDVQAARFGSPVDGFLTVYDADRKVIGSADDVNGSPDPVLTVTLPRDGTYFIALIDAHDLGGANFGYRLAAKKAK